MPRPLSNSFTQTAWESPEEEARAASLTGLQFLNIQNLLAETAHEIVKLRPDPLVGGDVQYFREHAFLSGKLNAYEQLLEASNVIIPSPTTPE